MEIWKRFLMARNELFKAENETLNADDESFIKAVHTVRDSINENNSSLSFSSELEKSITKKASGQKQQHTAMKENKTSQTKSTKRKFKVPFAKRNSEKMIPFEKVFLSSAEMVDTLGQKNTTLGKPVGVLDERKLCADNTIPQNIPIKPNPAKEYRYTDFERSGKLSRNRTRDLKGATFLLWTFCCLSS